MDNATFHKNIDMLKMIRDAGHIIEFLPPYSVLSQTGFMGTIFPKSASFRYSYAAIA
jgi:hypothetical protein